MDALRSLYLKMARRTPNHWLASELGRSSVRRTAAIKSSKLRKVDYGCTPEIASEVVAVINRRLRTYQKA
jgi:hypothetical protein